MTIEKVLEYTSKCIALTEKIAEETNDDNEIQRTVESIEYFMNVYSLLKELKNRMVVCDNVRTDVIEEYRKEMHDMIECNEEFTDWQKYEILECNELVAEQLKEQNHG